MSDQERDPTQIVERGNRDTHSEIPTESSGDEMAGGPEHGKPDSSSEGSGRDRRPGFSPEKTPGEVELDEKKAG